MHDAGGISGVDDAERSQVIDVSIGLTELGVIERVEEFGTEFQVHAFFDECVFQQRRVPVVQTRSREEPPLCGSQRPDRLRAEERGIKVRQS